MSLTDLQTVLQEQLDQHGVLAICAATLNAAGLSAAPDFDTILQGSLKLIEPFQLTVSGTVPGPVGSQLSVSGFSSMLGATALPTQVQFTLVSDGSVDVVLVAALPASWDFSCSFPALHGSLLTMLTLTAPSFLIATATAASYLWQGQTADLNLEQGLNFVASLGLAFPADLLCDLVASLAPDQTITLAGPINLAGIELDTGLPTLALTGTIDGAITANTSFQLSLPQVLVSTRTDENGLLSYWLAFGATLSVEGKPFSTLRAEVIPGSPLLTLSMLATDHPITPAQVAGLIGGVNYMSLIPVELQALFQPSTTPALLTAAPCVGLVDLFAIMNVKTGTLKTLGAAIGAIAPWQLGPFKIDNLVLNLTVDDPMGSGRSEQANFSATAAFFPKVFQEGDFHVEISAGMDGELAIGANFQGTVALKDLIGGISGSAGALPPALEAIEFDDFGVSFTKSGATVDWTLYGSAQALFTLALGTGEVDVTLQVLITSTGGALLHSLRGGLQVGEQFFDVEIDLTAADKQLSAHWTSRGTPIEFADLVAVFGWSDLPTIPAALDLGLTGAALMYDFTTASVAVGATSRSYGKLAFASLITGTADAQARQYVMCLATGEILNLSNLPLVGTELERLGSIAVSDLQVIIADAPVIDAAAIVAINALIRSLDPDYPTLPDGGVAAIFTMAANLLVGDTSLPLSVSLGDTAGARSTSEQGTESPARQAPLLSGDDSSAQRAIGTGSAPASDSTQWFDIQKSFGPVSIQKLGVSYSGGVLWVLMNAGLEMGPVDLGLVGLGVGSPLDTFTPKFTAHGVTLGLAMGPVSFSGALVGAIDPVNLYGELGLSLPQLSIGALGAYATSADDTHAPSCFLYAVIDAEIGGPSFFFVTGLAVGFGLNRSLNIPTITSLSTFPLVEWATGSGPSSTPTGAGADQVDLAMTTLAESGAISPAVGEYWFAAGVKFTSFQLIESFALLIVKAGNEVEIDLLGLSVLALPSRDAPIALAELALEASFSPAHELIAVTGQLTPRSYVLSQDCHLTGGFAFYMWFGGDFNGQFVLSLGGYSPRYDKPAQYPDVPRLGLNWQVSSELSVTGDEYFALTPSAIMAGGGLSAVWSNGAIRAWFSVEADFLLMFTPLHYYITASVDLGASVRVDLWFTSFTVSAHIGVEAEIWGPEFSGEVDVDLDIASFTISFGHASREPPVPIPSWSDFVAGVLPVRKDASTAMASRACLTGDTSGDADCAPVLQINATGGLVKALASVAGATRQIDWLVDCDALSIAVVSAIPLETVTFEGSDACALTRDPNDNSVADTVIGVGPMGIQAPDFTRVLKLTASSSSEATIYATQILGAVPKALWETRSFDANGIALGVDPLNNTVIANALTGFTLLPMVPIGAQAPLTVPILDLEYTNDETVQQLGWSEPVIATSDTFSTQSVHATINGDTATNNRAALIAAINKAGFAVDSAPDIAALADPASGSLMARPVLRYLVEEC